MSIAESYRRLRAEIPSHVTIVLAAKTRTADEVREAIAAGATDIGYNYVQEAAAMRAALGCEAGALRWHLIGRLQSNKINKALALFDVFQTVEGDAQAADIARRAAAAGKAPLPVLLEINSAREPAKSGLPPDLEAVERAAAAVSALPALTLKGLMTMGPADADGSQLRPFFHTTRLLFEGLCSRCPALALDTLSMGMSDSYREAIEEGATMVRVGTLVFGERPARA